MSEADARLLADQLVDYFNSLARLADQGLLIPEVRGLVLVALDDPYLTRDQEVELAKRYEAALFADETLADSAGELNEKTRLDLEWVRQDGQRAREHLVQVYDFLAVASALMRVDGIAGVQGAVAEERQVLAAAIDSYDYTKDWSCPAWIAAALAGSEPE